MSKTNSSLRSFLEKYYPKAPKSSKPKSFEDHLADSGSTYRDSYERAVSRAYLKRDTGLPGYGTLGQRLSENGLDSSGYADYLKDKSERTLSGDLASAYADRAKGEAKARAGYASYLEKFNKDRSEASERAFDKIVSGGVADIESAYAIALSAGLGSEDAMSIAESGLTTSKRRLVAKLMQSVLADGIDPDTAGLMAEQMGLDGEDRDRVVAYAERLREERTDISEELIAALEAQGSRDTVTGDRLAAALEEYIKLKKEERNNQK